MWSQSGNRFKYYEKDNDVDKLPSGIYTLEYGPFGSMYVCRQQNEFEFPYKLYGNDGFPERVIKTYRAVTGNLGVLLCGLKGTGKTVQAEQICNQSELPVILVTQDFSKGTDLVKFLSYVDQEVVVMIDEYEKLFGKSEGLLSIMDGVLNGQNRRLFILTANTMYVSDALIDRPSRIHYLKRFGNLFGPIISEVVDDMLDNPDFREEVIQYIAALEIVTIDIVKTVVAEVNRFNEPPQKFKDILNVTVHNQARWEVSDEEGNVLLSYATCDNLDPFMKGYDLRFKEFGDKIQDYGYIRSMNKKTGKIVTDKGTFTVIKAKPFSTLISRHHTAANE